jgi:hypothetical protein
LAFLAIALFFWSHEAKGQQPVVPKLTLAQIEQLVEHSVPDSTLSSQIQKRGLAFASNPAIVESLRAKGAGPLTLAAIEASDSKAPPRPETNAGGKAATKHPRATLGVGVVEVHTERGSELLLDGKDPENAGPLNAIVGIFRLENVTEGNHELTAKKAGFKDAHVSFALADKEDKKISLPLEWMGGFLAVSAQPTGGYIHITGPKSFDGSAEDVECPPGSYAVTFSAHGYLNQTRTFQIAAGEHHVERAQLVVDPAFITNRLADANTKLGVGNPTGAIEDAHEVLKLSPANVKAEAILSEASFQAGDMNTFVNSGTVAIRNGEAVTVMLMHVHDFPHRMVHRATITISNLGIDVAAAPAVNGCKIPPSILFRQITQTQLLRDQTGAIELHISYLSKPPEKTRFIGSVHDLDFVVEGSAVVNQPGTIVVLGGDNTPIQSPDNAAQVLQGVANLILALKG